MNWKRTTRMKMKMMAVLVGVALLGVASAGCGTITGGAIGAASGAAIGAGTGYGAGKGAAIGAGVGAVGGTIYQATR